MTNPITLNPMSNAEFDILKEVTSKYLRISPNGASYSVLSNNCIDLDRDAKKIIDELVVLNKEGKQAHINFLMFANKLILDKFNQYSCRNRIEDTRLDDVAIVSTTSAIKAEKSVLGKSNSEITTYSVIGALIILSTLVILLTNKK